MSREVKDVSITKLEDGRFRAAIAYHEGDQVADTEVESFDTFAEATDFVIEREASPAPAPAPKEQTELGGRVDAPGESSTSVDPNAQDSPVSQLPQDSPVDQTAASPINPADLQNTNTAASDGLAGENDRAQAEQDAGTAN